MELRHLPWQGVARCTCRGAELEGEGPGLLTPSKLRHLNRILIEFVDCILLLPKSEFAVLMLPYKSNVFGGTGIEGLQLLVFNQ